MLKKLLKLGKKHHWLLSKHCIYDPHDFIFCSESEITSLALGCVLHKNKEEIGAGQGEERGSL